MTCPASGRREVASPYGVGSRDLIVGKVVVDLLRF
jgi:hypothetical protein